MPKQRPKGGICDPITVPRWPSEYSTHVQVSKVYDLSMLDDIRAGKAPVSIDEEVELASQAGSSAGAWDPASLMHSLGL